MPVEKYFKGSGKDVMKSMKSQYGDKKGESVFYATAHKQNMKPPSYEKGGIVPDDGTITAHKGELVLPARKMKPVTPEDTTMSADHLHDSVAFNARHAADHIGNGLKAEKALADRGQTPRTGSMRDAVARALTMDLEEHSSPFEHGAAPSEPTDAPDPVAERKSRQRRDAEAAVKSSGLPSNFTKGERSPKVKK